MKNYRAYKKLLEKVRLRDDYFAFFLDKYQKYEKLDNENLKVSLECTDDEILRLALCRVPDMEAKNFVERINRIAVYTNIPHMKIIKIL